jgi:sucrose-6F-phosphate phosphohydrolase
MAKRMLVTDLDGTLVRYDLAGQDPGLGRLLGALPALRQDALLVYATGRTMAQARRLQAERDFPEPDAWVTEVGASIAYAAGGCDLAWDARIAKAWHRATVERTCDAEPVLVRQPEEAMGVFKLSYRLPPAAAAAVLPGLGARLHALGVPVRLIYSSQRDLDVVPAAAGKGNAIAYLMRRYGIPLGRVLACGDSANDRDMLSLGCPAVVVGNALDELLGGPLPATVYRASGCGPDGILEALAHYGWLEAPTVRTA